jgi:hypothetical protein
LGQIYLSKTKCCDLGFLNTPLYLPNAVKRRRSRE